MKHIGSYLKDIRKEWGKTQKEVSDHCEVTLDFLSKVERGKRKPTYDLLKKISTYYSIPYESLLDIYLSDELLEILDKVDDPTELMKITRKRLKNPNHIIQIPNSKPLKKEKVKQKYVKGGKHGKVKGLNYYIQSNGKLKKKERESLIRLSEEYMTLTVGTELDSSLSDIELVEEWNQFFDQHGMKFPEFEESWFKENPIPDEMKNEPSNSEKKKVELPNFIKQKMKEKNRSDLG